MTQTTPRPLPDQGTGWGHLLRFGALVGVVAFLGAGAIVSVVLQRFDGRVPAPLQYLVVVVLLGAVGVSVFTVLVAATAGMYHVVALLVGLVFVPLSIVVLRRRGSSGRHLATLTHAAVAWSLPFLAGVGVVAFIGSRGGGVPPAIAGVLAVVIVVSGTILVDHLSVLPDRDGEPD